jgi:hypothetical protein
MDYVYTDINKILDRLSTAVRHHLEVGAIIFYCIHRALDGWLDVSAEHTRRKSDPW